MLQRLRAVIFTTHNTIRRGELLQDYYSSDARGKREKMTEHINGLDDKRTRVEDAYGVPEGIISSFPVTITNGKVEIVQGLEIDDFSRAKIDASAKELADERDAVKELGLI